MPESNLALSDKEDSRGKNKNISNNPLWLEGPLLLKSESSEWPSPPCEYELEMPLAMKEQVKSEPKITHAMSVLNNKSLLCMEKVFQCYFCDKNHFSNECKEITGVKE